MAVPLFERVRLWPMPSGDSLPTAWAIACAIGHDDTTSHLPNPVSNVAMGESLVTGTAHSLADILVCTAVPVGHLKIPIPE